MCPFLPLFVQESAIRGVGVLVSVFVAHFGVMVSEGRMSHRGEGSDVSSFRVIASWGRGAGYPGRLVIRVHGLTLVRLVPGIGGFQRHIEAYRFPHSAWRRRVKKTR
jgi:hypothetical protein